MLVAVFVWCLSDPVRQSFAVPVSQNTVVKKTIIFRVRSFASETEKNLKPSCAATGPCKFF